MSTLDTNRVPLQGISLIEASAGTGKTYAIASLYVRILLEKKLRVNQVLVVTFTTAATAELKERLRERLLLIQAALLLGECPSDDTVDRYVKQRVAHNSIALDCKIIEMALRDFDTAAILTIHSFCQKILQDSALESGISFGFELLRDENAILEQIVCDFWSNEMVAREVEFVRFVQYSSPRLSLDELRGLAKKVTQDNNVVLLPKLTELGGTALTTWKRVHNRASKVWQESKEEISLLLLDTKAMNQSKYKQQTIREKWLTMMDDTMSPGQLGIPLEFEKFEKFTPSLLSMGTKKGANTPQHDFFDLCDQLLLLHCDLEKEKLAMKLRLASYVRSTLAQYKEERGLLSFDDLLTHLRSALQSAEGKTLVGAVRRQYPAALIDEFQDTDPVQYEIFSRLYKEQAQDICLFLIGDPKQAIYSFRGADVFAYMNAREDAEQCHSLDTNWRSDPALVQANNTLMQNVPHAFLYEKIPFTSVKSRPNVTSGLLDPAEEGAMVISFIRREGIVDSKKQLSKSWANAKIPLRCAQDIVSLLNRKAQIEGRDVLPEDIAVLVRTNKQAREMQQRLRTLRVPAIIDGDASVFESKEAEEIERILWAILLPTDSRLLVSALSTSLFGVDAATLHLLREGEGDWQYWVGCFRAWNTTWKEKGFVRAFRLMFQQQEISSRLLSVVGGQRALTNAYHIGELVEAYLSSNKIGMFGLLRWFQRMRIDIDARKSEIGDTGQLRLEKDSAALQIVTIHKSKGLEYPVVFCPALWDGSLLRKSEVKLVRFHGLQPNDGLFLDIGSNNLREHQALAEKEILAENLRVLYVALTRAKHRCVVYWGAIRNMETSGLGYLLHGTAEQSVSMEALNAHFEHLRTMSDDCLLDDLHRLAKQSEQSILVKISTDQEALYDAEQPVEPVGAARIAHRRIASLGRFSSFSSLVSKHKTDDNEFIEDLEAHHFTSFASEEPPDDYNDILDVSSLRETVPLAGFPKGVNVGLLIHQIFEEFMVADYEDPTGFSVKVGPLLERFNIQKGQEECLRLGLVQAIEAPFGESSICLSQLAGEDCLKELEFLFPLHDVSFKAGKKVLQAETIGALLREYSNAPWPSSYPSLVQKLDFAPLQGFMRGFIDLLFCHEERWYILDYKSNHLGDTVTEYQEEKVHAAMAEHHYYLQYLIYVVALHRYLGARILDYDYNKHVGGVFFLFIRGMSCSYPKGSGVFTDKPPKRLIESLSTLLGGGREA